MTVTTVAQRGRQNEARPMTRNRRGEWVPAIPLPFLGVRKTVLDVQATVLDDGGLPRALRGSPHHRPRWRGHRAYESGAKRSMSPWARLDDGMHDHPKVLKAWNASPRALGLHLLAMSYCGAHLTDGFVPDDYVLTLFRNVRDRNEATSTLVGCGLWRREPDGYRINDWLDYNPSRLGY